MSAKQEYRRTSHSVYLCDYHLILTTKYRHSVIGEELWKHLYGKIVELTKHYPTIYIKEANHDKDHVHLLISIPPQMSVGSVVRLLKTNTARNLKKQFPILNKYFWGTDGIWSEGYFVSTLGVGQEIIKRYIANQGELDTGQRATLFD
jgi:putative transposase